MNILNDLVNSPSAREVQINREESGVIYNADTIRTLYKLKCYPSPVDFGHLHMMNSKLRDLKVNYPLGQYFDVNCVINVLAGAIFASLLCTAVVFALSGMPLYALVAGVSGITLLAMSRKFKYSDEATPQNFSLLRDQLDTDISRTEIWLDKCIKQNQEIVLEDSQKQALDDFIDSMRRFLSGISKE